MNLQDENILPSPLSLLVVEDSDLDYRHLVRHVRKSWPEVVARRVETAKEMRQALLEKSWDVVVADVHLPSFSAERALELHKELVPTIPFIAISGVVAEEKAVGLIHAGAHDFVTKQNLARFLPAVERGYREARERLMRRQAEEALQASEEQFRSVAESANDAIITTNDAGEILFWNKGARMTFGYETEEVVGKPLVQLIPERYRQAHLEGLARFREAGHGRLAGKRLEMDALRKDGTEIPIEISVSSWMARRERFFSAIIRDITERRQFQKSLNALLVSAQAASQAKSEFLSHMSHEIRTPLNTILGMSGLLAELGLPEDDARYVRLLNQAGEHLLALINNILDLSKIEAGEMAIHAEPFDLRELAQGTVDILLPQANGKGITLVLELEPGLEPHRMGDFYRLREVLLNLLGNAVKFSDHGVVRLKIFREGWNLLHFQVADQGIGIPPEKLEAIFLPFAQADATTTRRYGGTGLGLTICQRLVELMGGRIWVESCMGEGSRFHFTLELPVATPTLCAVPSLSPEGRACTRATPSEHPLEILLVDDSSDSHALIQAYLKKTPHHLTVVDNGRDGVKKVQERRFDLVLMDIQMPVMDGYAATEAIRAWESTHNGGHPLPIIALTANAMQEDAELALRSGCDLHLGKPVLKPQFLEVIQHFATKSPEPEIIMAGQNARRTMLHQGGET